MYLAFHGGACCGIKHIHALGYSPTALAATQPVMSAPTYWDSYQTIYRDKSFPTETYLDRMKRLLLYAKATWPQHMIEVTTASRSFMSGQTQNWDAALLELGFVRGHEWTNSNSSNKVRLYHLSWDDVNNQVFNRRLLERLADSHLSYSAFMEEEKERLPEKVVRAKRTKSLRQRVSEAS